MFNEEDLEIKAKLLQKQGNDDLASEEPPWMPDETMATIIKHVKAKRESNGEQWLQEIESKFDTLNDMDVGEVNGLYNRISNSPPYLSSSQIEKNVVLLSRVEIRLKQINVQWMVEKYKELDPVSREEFLEQINTLAHK
jgi:hypothetical protein